MMTATMIIIISFFLPNENDIDNNMQNPYATHLKATIIVTKMCVQCEMRPKQVYFQYFYFRLSITSGIVTRIMYLP